MHGAEGEGGLSHLSAFFLEFLSAYGWLFAIVIAFFIFGREKLLNCVKSLWNSRVSSKPEESEAEMTARLKEKELATRKRQQEEYDRIASEHAEKMKQQEAEKRVQRIAELEGRSSSGKGHRLGSSDDQNVSSSTVKPKGSRIRQSEDYNPLMGSGGLGGFRSSRNCGPRGG